MDLYFLVSTAFNLFFFALIVYQIEMHRRELQKKDEMIKDLELKFISKNVAEYSSVRDEEPENMNRESEDPYIPVEDVSVDDLLEAEDNL